MTSRPTARPGAMAARVAATSPRHAFLVAELDGVVTGRAVVLGGRT